MHKKNKSRELAVKILYALILTESITVLFLLIFNISAGRNLYIISVFVIVLLFFAAAFLSVRYKKYDFAKYIIITVPPYAVLAISIIEKHFNIFNNVFSFLNPRFFEIIYLMVPVILFGLPYKRKLIISLLIILPAAILFSPVHFLFGIDTGSYISDKEFYRLFIVIFSFFYSISIVSVLFFQKTSLLYLDEIKSKTEEIIKEKEELSDIKKRFVLAQKAGKIGVWEWNVKENIIYWTDTAYEIFGVRKTEKKLSNEDFFKTVHKDDIKRLEKELNYALENGIKNLKTNYRIIKKGEVRYIEEMSEIFKNERGEFVKMTGVLHDVTDKVIYEKQLKDKNEELLAVEEELRQSNEELRTVKEEIEKQYDILLETTEKYQLLSDNITDMIWMISFDAELLYVSPSCKKFLGYSAEEVKNIPLSKLHTQKSYKIIKKLIKSTKEKQNVNTKNKVTKIEIEYIHKNGNIIIAEVTGNVIYKSGKMIGIGGVSRDVTDRKKAEEALLETNTKLVELHTDLLENLKYAKKIQDALLTQREVISGIFEDYFLLFRPRYTVGGDFYYVIKYDKNVTVAVGDCTGHGISGGFLTMIAITYLHEIIGNKMVTTPAHALEVLRKKFKRTYRNFGADSANAFNISLCMINTETYQMQFAGAYHSLFLVRENELREFKSTRNPVGFYFKETKFTDTRIKLTENDKIYLFSDGYYDQINDQGKKIGKKTFKKLITDISALPFSDQEQKLNDFILEWKQSQNLIDDITVLGFKIK